MRIKYHHRQYTAVRTFVSGCEGPSIAVLVRSVLVVWRVKPNNLISIILFLNLSRDQACDRGITFLPRRRAWCGTIERWCIPYIPFRRDRQVSQNFSASACMIFRK